MTELRTHEAAPAAGPPPVPSLRLVPDLAHPVRPLGDGVLPEPADLDQPLVLVRRVRVTHDVVTLVLRPTVPVPVAFAPGQYLALTVEVDGQPVERCYTISSPPTRPHLLTITVKRVPGGAVSAALHDDLQPGDVVHARGPLGLFTVAEHPAARYLLLSAGSGVTPTLATLRTIADLAEPADVVVVHSARSGDDLVCRPELDALAEAHDGLRVHWLRDDVEGLVGPALLGALVPDAADREVFTCGPPGYMAAVRALLPDLGVDPLRCHEESFVLGERGAPVLPRPAEPAQPTGPTDAATPVPLAAPVVRFRRSGREVVCGPGATVLDAAVEAGVALPSSCHEGLCGTCKSTLLSGRVDMHHQGGIRPREVAQDKFLPCCSVPQGDIEVDA